MTDAEHPALLMVDTIASLACMPYEMDAWDVDVTVAGSQKGLMTPPGLAFVAARGASPRRPPPRRPRHPLLGLVVPGGGRALPEVLRHRPRAPDVRASPRPSTCCSTKGSSGCFRRHALLADATRAAVGRWAEGGAFGFNVLEPSERSNSVTTLRFEEHDPQRVLDFCRERCGVVLGIGIGPELSGRAIRIAHMGHVNAPMALGVLGTFENRPRRPRPSARQGRSSRGGRLARRGARRRTREARPQGRVGPTRRAPSRGARQRDAPPTRVSPRANRAPGLEGGEPDPRGR